MLAVATESDQLTLAMRALEAAFLIGVEGVCEIWLIRHADCYQDAGYDVEDPALSALGREQAALLAKRVRRATPAAVYASPYRRALETARIRATTTAGSSRSSIDPFGFISSAISMRRGSTRTSDVMARAVSSARR